MTSTDGPPASATGKDATPYYSRAGAAIQHWQSGVVAATVPDQTPYQFAKSCVERCNAAIRRLNELKHARRTTAQSGDGPVSEDEEELDLPILADFVPVPTHNPGVLPEGVTEPHAGVDRGENGRPSFPDVFSVMKHGGWKEITSPNVANEANVNKNQVMDCQTLGLVYREASKNMHTLSPRGMPNPILQMAHGRIYIPLSMLTTAALNRVRTNDNLKYTEAPNSVVEQTLDPTQFGAEDDLSYDYWAQAYNNWIKLLKIIAEPKIVAGWVDHRDNMYDEEDWARWSQAWRKMDKQLRMQFTAKPFIVDPTSDNYLFALSRARIDLLADNVYPRPDNRRPRLGDRPRHSSLPDNRYHPYSDVLTSNNHNSSNNHPNVPGQSSSFPNSRDHSKALCLRCGVTGHRASDCSASSANRPERTIIVEWKNKRLLTKSGRELCFWYNVRSNCTDNRPHGDHSCSLCGDSHHGAAQCTRN